MADIEPAAKRPSVFISYARDDDEPFVARLHDDLKRRNIGVWWDRKAMESRGRTFLQEIRDAIEGVDKVIAVVGPEAVASDYVGYEWAHASLFAKTVVPVLRLGDYDLIPEAILPETGYGLAEDAPGRRHGEDFRDDGRYDHALDRLIEILEAPVPDLGPLDGTPALPPHFLPRRDDIKRLQDTVLADVNRPTVITSAKQTVALQGMGGIGKSVLAAAFARTISTRRALDDGVVWLTAGQEASQRTVLANMINLGAALGDETAAYTNRQTATTRLSQLLRDKTCLIVLDDVWSLEQIEPFRDALGPRCRLLMTTRDGGLVTACDAREHSVDVLSDEMSLALLSDWSEQEVADLPAEARVAARECGNLPLALAMVGAMCRGKPDRWDNALHRLRTADLEKLKRQFPNYPYPDLLRAIEASVNALEPDVRARYLDFAVFPEDTPIPEAALATFWEREGLNKYDCQDVIDALISLSLARRDEQGRLTLHDLQRDYVRKQVEDVPALHGQLLKAYRAKCANGWASGPNDGYYFQHLPWHLAEAGEGKTLRVVLFDFRWLRRKLEVVGVNDVLRDFALLPGVEEADAIAATIRLSAHVLASDPTQLTGQLWGRLSREIGPCAADLLVASRSQGDRPAILPLRPTLTSPETGEIQRFACQEGFEVTALTAMANGKRVISGIRDGTIRLWELESGEEIRRLIIGHDRQVTAVAVTMDGRRAISGSLDGTVSIWDPESGAVIGHSAGHEWGFRAVVVTADGRYAMSGSDNGTVRLWDLNSGQEIRCLVGHEEGVANVSVTRDGGRAIVSSLDGTVRLWDLSSGNELCRFVGHKGNFVWVTAVTSDSRRAISGAYDHTVRFWDLESGKEVNRIPCHANDVNCVSVTSDSRRAVSGSRDGNVYVWDLEDGREIRHFVGHADAVLAVAFTADGKRVISSAYDQTIRLWDLDKGGAFQQSTAHQSVVSAVAMTADGRRLVSGSSDETLRLWDLEKGAEIRRIAGRGWISAVAVTGDGRQAISGDWNGTVRLWDLESGEEIWSFCRQGHHIDALAITADGRCVVSDHGGALFQLNNTVRLWNLNSGEAIRCFVGDPGGVKAVQVMTDGRHAISGSIDGTVRLWDLESGEEIRCLQGHESWVSAVAVTADGRRAVSGSHDRTVRLWELGSGEEIRRLADHEDEVCALAVTADGRRVVSGSRDKTVRLWDLESGKEIARLDVDAAVHCCALGTDGRRIVVGDGLGRIHVLRILD